MSKDQISCSMYCFLKLNQSLRDQKLLNSFVLSLRWRTSFLWSLIFGVPSLVIMMYFMFASPPDDHTPVANTTGSNSTTTIKPQMSSDGHYQIMIVPGLSLDNLLMFILATPVQVSLQNNACDSIDICWGINFIGRFCTILSHRFISTALSYYI